MSFFKSSHLISGRNKREDFFNPIRREDPWQLSHLKEAADFIKSWHTLHKAHSLTQPTFIAVHQTLSVLSEMGHQLLRDSLFYLLPGKLSSDPIEARFGAYRRLSGSNFYISCKQLFEAEKKLRTMNFIRSEIPISKLNLTVDSFTNGENSLPSDTDLELFNIPVTEIDTDELEEGESATLYYVAGYVGRSISRRNKCDDCKKTLISDVPVIPEERTQILDDTNHGGLCAPSELCHAICLLAFLCFKRCQRTEKLQQLMSQHNQKDVFVANVMKHLSSNLGLKAIQVRNCLSGHSIIRPLIGSIFNCFAKNLKRQLNAESDSTSKTQKIKKLQSKY